jgi:hypothetical protein
MPFQVIKFLDKFSNFDSPNKLANYGSLGGLRQSSFRATLDKGPGPTRGLNPMKAQFEVS